MVTPAYPPFVGGGERYAHALATRLAARGHEVTVLTSDAGREADLSRTLGCRVVKVPGPLAGQVSGVRTRARHLLLPLWRKAMITLSALPGDQSGLLLRMARRVPHIVGMDEALEGLAADVVHGFNLSWEHPLTLAWGYARRHRVPLIVTPFLHPGRPGDRRVLRNHSMDHQRRILCDAAAVLALTEVERAALIGLGVAAERIHVVGGGIDEGAGDAEADHSAELAASLPASTPLALFIGRVCRDKGALQAIEAVRRLRGRGVAVALALVGAPSPEFTHRYQRLSAQERAYILPFGVVDEATKEALLRRATMLLLPSAVESLGLVVLEAWLHAKPVIGARAGGLMTIIDEGRDGLLVEHGDAAGLAEAMAALLADPARAERLGLAGRDKARALFTWDAVVERVEAAYRCPAPWEAP